ncbi:MAG TPA: hypothetical protein VK807_23330 [Gemmatimonadaceae bacterium]|jgi:hypothetical protein|nr:hypothetical protein [Gemmatimonadaceae bacterium]
MAHYTGKSRKKIKARGELIEQRPATLHALKVTEPSTVQTEHGVQVVNAGDYVTLDPTTGALGVMHKNIARRDFRKATATTKAAHVPPEPPPPPPVERDFDDDDDEGADLDDDGNDGDDDEQQPKAVADPGQVGAGVKSDLLD